MSTNTPPDWYVGLTPWHELPPAERLWNAVEAYDGSNSYEQLVEDAGFQMRDEAHYDVVSGVMRFAGRNGDTEEMITGLEWLTDIGYVFDQQGVRDWIAERVERARTKRQPEGDTPAAD